MIYRVLTISLIIIAFVIGYYYAVNKIGKTKQSLFAQKLHAHYIRLARNIDDKSVVFIGSSSIQGMDVSKVSPNGINLGIGGENIQGLIVRLTQYPRLMRAQAVVVAAGFNDICHKPLAEIISDYEKLIGMLGHLPKVISSLQPSNNKQVCTDIASRIELFNGFVMRLCNTDDLCRYVDLSAVIKEADINAFEQDDIHLNSYGYRLWYEHMRTQLEQVLLVRR